MDNLEKLARELGKAIQSDERYVKFIEAGKTNDADTELGALMSKINLIQVSYQQEASKENPDEGKMKAYDEEFRGVYTEIMQNENMRNYQLAAKEFDDALNYVIGIIHLCAQGDDPDTCDPTAHDGCDCGDCHTCGGCDHEH